MSSGTLSSWCKPPAQPLHGARDSVLEDGIRGTLLAWDETYKYSRFSGPPARYFPASFGRGLAFFQAHGVAVLDFLDDLPRERVVVLARCT